MRKTIEGLQLIHCFGSLNFKDELKMEMVMAVFSEVIAYDWTVVGLMVGSFLPLSSFTSHELHDSPATSYMIRLLQHADLIKRYFEN